jgi:hypothetical protein
MAISFASVISETYATGGEAEKVINACKEALEQPVPPAKTTSLEDVIKEFEKDPEMKALLDLARKQVRGMELKQPAQEPVAFTNADEMQELKEGMTTCYMYKERINHDCIPLYTHPAQPLNKTAERDYNFMRDLAIGAEELLSKTIKELDEVKELLAQRNLELIAARDMLLNKHME